MSSEYTQDDQQNQAQAGAPPDAYTAPQYSAAAGAPDAPRAAGAPPTGAAYDPAYRGAYGTPLPGAPNPGLAALLGFIPGVGAMYNGQFAKGIAHIAIFAVFSSLSKNVNGIFGLFVAGWVLYMVFEAYQTALARRDGLPLPDPFGLNNIGERFGFRGGPNPGAFWAHGAPPSTPHSTAEGARTNTGSGYPYYSSVDPVSQQATYQVDPTGHVSYATGSPFGQPTGAPPQPAPFPPYATPPAGVYPPTSNYPAAPGPVYPAYPMPPIPPLPTGTRTGLPVGALWLIGLGFFALLGSIHAFDFLEGEATGGIFLIGLSLFLVWRHWNTNRVLYPQGSPLSDWGLVVSARGAWILFVVGLLTLLQGLHIAYWENSWPFLLIAIGVVLLLERLAFNPRVPLTGASPQAAPFPPATVSDSSIPHQFTSAGEDTTPREGQ